MTEVPRLTLEQADAIVIQSRVLREAFRREAETTRITSTPEEQRAARQAREAQEIALNEQVRALTRPGADDLEAVIAGPADSETPTSSTERAERPLTSAQAWEILALSQRAEQAEHELGGFEVEMEWWPEPSDAENESQDYVDPLYSDHWDRLEDQATTREALEVHVYGLVPEIEEHPIDSKLTREQADTIMDKTHAAVAATRAHGEHFARPERERTHDINVSDAVTRRDELMQYLWSVVPPRRVAWLPPSALAREQATPGQTLDRSQASTIETQLRAVLELERDHASLTVRSVTHPGLRENLAAVSVERITAAEVLTDHLYGLVPERDRLARVDSDRAGERPADVVDTEAAKARATAALFQARPATSAAHASSSTSHARRFLGRGSAKTRGGDRDLGR